jgi:eukaryotic-like serine/threonine-protein kinase
VAPDLQQRLQAALGDAFRLERELPRGGMSRLFLATEASLNRQVVVKVLPPEFTSQVSSDRFRQEIELAAHLQHPNILPVLTAGTRNELLYYITPYVAGESLRHRLTREGRLPISDATRILHEIADALAYAHAEGVIHRDIKPENILLEGGHAVITDFGVARAVAAAGSGDRLTDTGLALGTPGYMAPEQAMGSRQVDARADVYALAVVGYEMFAGAPPFAGATAQALVAAHLTATPRPLAELRPDVPPEIARAIGRALIKDPEDRLRTAAEFRDATAAVGTAQALAPPRRRWIPVAAALVAVVLALAAGSLLLRRESEVTLDADVVAVAPFNVLAPNLALWREGLVDLLSRNLDGAGSLRTVAPSTVIRRWSGRADPPSAQELGRRTGAGLAVFGQLVPTGGDSVRLTATLFDVAGGRRMAELEFRDASASIDRLADSLTVGVLRQLGQSRPVGAVRATALRSTSLPALKAFLQGEQLFRRAAWDSALSSYRRAVEIDSGFALAWRRMGSVVGWRIAGGDSLSEVYLFRAANLNRGLPPRESLLVTAESLSAAMYTNSADTAWRAHQARLFATLEQATRRYPEDPEAWYELGDARLHFRHIGRTSLEQVLAPFDHAIAADSSFGLSYLHAIEVAIQLGRPELAQKYIAGFLTHLGSDNHAEGMRLVARLLASPARTPELERLIDISSADVLFTTVLALWAWPDSLESAVRLARALAASRPSKVPAYNDPLWRSWWLSSALASRGRFREAYEVGGDSVARVSEMAVLGGVPPADVAALFGRWLRDPPIHAVPDAIPFGFNLDVLNALPWWAARRDTLSLAAFASRMRSLESRSPSDVHPWLRYGAASAEAYRALARGDTAGAVSRFTSLPNTVCPCVYDQVVTAQLLLQGGRDKEAAAVFEGHYPPFMSPVYGLWRLQRGRALERLGRKDEAAEDYRFTAAVWRHADPELQPYVTEAKQALARLTAEPRP